jgi:hypothetical protein
VFGHFGFSFFLLCRQSVGPHPEISHLPLRLTARTQPTQPPASIRDPSDALILVPLYFSIPDYSRASVLVSGDIKYVYRWRGVSFESYRRFWRFPMLRAHSPARLQRHNIWMASSDPFEFKFRWGVTVGFGPKSTALMAKGLAKLEKHRAELPTFKLMTSL